MEGQRWLQQSATNGRGLDLHDASSAPVVVLDAPPMKQTPIGVLCHGFGLRQAEPGDCSGEAIPVPIPNTEVKLSSAENTEGAAPRQDRSSPGSLASWGVSRAILGRWNRARALGSSNLQEASIRRVDASSPAAQQIPRALSSQWWCAPNAA